MNPTRKKRLLRAAVCGFLLSALGSLFPFAAASEAMPENILRLHVIAHSDAPEDQAVKLLVRDAVLEEAAVWCADASDLEDANAAVCLHLEAIRQAGERALRETGSTLPLRAAVTERYFPTREYEGFALPAGRYRTLQIRIGAGEGKNWWCVVFPALCLPAAGDREELLAVLPESQRDVARGSGQVRIKFKAVELLEELKNGIRELVE